MRKIVPAFLRVGLPVSVTGLLCMALLLCSIDLPLRYYAAAAAFPVLCGCFAAGYSAGKRLRKNGWRSGLLAALLLTAFWYAAAGLHRGALQSPMMLLAALPCGMCGGIFGVNSAQPKPRRRLHGAARLRQKLRFYPAAFHRPKRPDAKAIHHFD